MIKNSLISYKTKHNNVGISSENAKRRITVIFQMYGNIKYLLYIFYHHNITKSTEMIKSTRQNS